MYSKLLGRLAKLFSVSRKQKPGVILLSPIQISLKMTQGPMTTGRLKRFMNGACRIAAVFILALLLAVAASAYTVVMRGGRRVEIPSTFVVTQNTLTYEVSTGIQITLAMTAIDIAATEKANNESPGSLLQRAARPAVEVAPRGSRTITNRDLEPSMRRRRESELAYEARRKQLGLPTLEETRRQAASVPDMAGGDLEQKLIADQAAETYWRGRASALRTEMARLDAELNYLRGRLEEVSFGTTGSLVAHATFLPFISFGNVGHGRSFPRAGARPPNVFSAPRAGSPTVARVNLGGGAARGHVFVSPGKLETRTPLGRAHLPARAVYAPGGYIGQSFDYAYERNALITQFNGLAASRAGLNAAWRELEDEARRAGAPPGWLRP